MWRVVVLLMNVLFVAYIVGLVLLARWLVMTWGGWGAVMFMGVAPVMIVVHRLTSDRWFWQEDGDDIIDLD